MSRVFYAGSCKNAEFTCPRKFQWTYLPNGRTMAMTSVRPDFQLLIETALVWPGEGDDENIGGDPILRREQGGFWIFIDCQ